MSDTLFTKIINRQIQIQQWRFLLRLRRRRQSSLFPQRSQPR